MEPCIFQQNQNKSFKQQLVEYSMVQATFREFISLVKFLTPNFTKICIVFASILVVYELLKIIPVILIQQLIDILAVTPEFNQTIWQLSGIFIISIVILIIMAKFAQHTGKTAVLEQKRVLEQIFDKLMILPLSYHESNNSGAQLSKITKATKYISEFLWFLSNDVLPTLIQLVLTGAVLFWVDYRIGLIFILFLPVILYVINIQFQKTQPEREQYHKHHNDATAQLAQSLSNIQTVKGYGNEKYEASKHKTILEKYVGATVRRHDAEYPMWILREVMVNIVRIIAIGLAVFLFVKGYMTLGTVVLVFTLLEKAFVNIYRMGRIYFFMGDTFEGLNALRQIYLASETITSGKQTVSNGNIQLQNVSFKYESEMILKNITTTIEKNKTIAIIGKSGSGKTTLAKLLSRQYDVTAGSITINETNIKEFKLNQLRERILYVSQQSEVFDRTIKENIAYGNPNASMAIIIKAAKQANIHDFIMSCPEKYDTEVGERGVKLSGGQKQRLCIARALLVNPFTIIFDEATSSLDSENEQQIQKAILGIKKKTLIIIAHRLSTIQHADVILIMDNGKIVESGTHTDLLSKKGLYRKMIQLQKLGELRK